MKMSIILGGKWKKHQLEHVNNSHFNCPTLLFKDLYESKSNQENGIGVHKRWTPSQDCFSSVDILFKGL